jgi:DNA-binding response OmpR family regulator
MIMRKILVAEDERDILDLIIFTLQFGGYDVVPTTNGEDALEMVYKEKPDLILLDVRMPRMSGYEVCKRVKTEQDLCNIPVVFLSAKGQEAEVLTGYDMGAIDYILKPFAPDMLLERLDNILSNPQMQSDLRTS